MFLLDYAKQFTTRISTSSLPVKPVQIQEGHNGTDLTGQGNVEEEPTNLHQLTLEEQRDDNDNLPLPHKEETELTEEDKGEVRGKSHEYFEGLGQITNLGQGMADGIVSASDTLYLFSQRQFSSQPLFLHDRVWIKARKYALEWRIFQMKFHKDPKVEEMEARQKFSTLPRKVKSVTPADIELEPLATALGAGCPKIKTTLVDVQLMRGDWLNVRTEVEATVGNYSSGKMSISLVDRQEVKGKITSTGWDGQNLYAVINSFCFVPPFLLATNPDLVQGSLVKATTFKSEQGNFWWRAATIMEDTTAVGTVEKERLSDLFSDKMGINVTPAHVMDFGKLRIGSMQESSFNLLNPHNSETRVLQSVKMQGYQSSATFTITHNQESSDIVAVFPPHQSGDFHVKIRCEPLFIGQTSDICIFDFGDFQIYKEVRVRVTPEESQNKLMEDLTANRVPLREYRKITAAEQREIERKHEPFELPGREVVSAGVKQVRKAFFKTGAERIHGYPIPNSVKEAVKRKDASILFHHFPTLSATREELEKRVRQLTPENYTEMFHAGLWMEEHFHQKRRQNENMENVVLGKSGDLHFFDFPNVQDVYPKFQVNDPIQFVDPRDPEAKVYRANIVRLGTSAILLQLNPDFPASYTGKPLSVEFLLGRRSYRRNHHAVDKVMGNWGADWLFPTEVITHFPRITFIDEEVTSNGNHNDYELEQEPMTHLFTNTGGRGGSRGRRLRKVGGGIPAGGMRLPNIHQESMDEMRKKRAADGGERNPDLPVDMTLKWQNKSLNEEQKSAIRMILRGQCRPCPYIIFGPPGTGKTVTVVEAVIQIFRLDPQSRILVCGPSNASANQISTYLIEYGKFCPGEFVRLLGWTAADACASMSELLKNYSMDGTQIQNAYMSRIIVTTCNSAAQFIETFGIEEDWFTHVFIDEAGYCHEPDSLIPITLLTKNIEPAQVILAGDPKQLGPVLFDDYSGHYGLRISLLERLMENPLYKRGLDGKYNGILITKLIRNYRAHRDLLHLPSTLFYDNELIPASTDNLEELCLRLPFLPKPGIPLVFQGIKGDQCKDSNSPSWYNPMEVLEVIRWVKQLLEHNCIPDDIGIITPYRKQVEKIKEALSKEVKCRPIRVGSVEEFQGGEKKIIILSLVRSMKIDDESDCLHHFYFAFHPKRFNVCITRAKSLLISVGNPHVFGQENVWYQFIKYAIQKDVYMGCDLPLHLKRFARKTDISPQGNGYGIHPRYGRDDTDSDEDDE